MPHDPWAWKPDPFAIALLGATALLYGAGLLRLQRRGGLRHIAAIEIAAFVLGWLTLAVALLSPLATLSEWLFSVHMTQHELLMLVAAPLLALGRPVPPMLFALPRRWRRQAHRLAGAGLAAWVTSPAVVFALHALALWVWHLPALYEAAVRHDQIHIVQHICFTGTACLFWWSLVRGRYGRLGYGAAFLYVFATAVHSGGLGALLVFSPVTWYTWYEARSAGLTDPLRDQQLGGLIMWIPSGIAMMILALALFAAWLGEAERRRRRGWT